VLTIRNATVHDVPAVLKMLHDSAADQGFPNEVGVTEEDLRADGFGDAPLFRILIGEWNGERAALALFFFNYSSWGSKTVLYLEDLYVGPDFRHRGIARALLSRLAEIALEKGCSRMQWLVHSANTTAIRFYESLGARGLSDWTLMTLKGDAIDNLANRPTSTP
jgi:GNAT superfamily N-acetyltransferase